MSLGNVFFACPKPVCFGGHVWGVSLILTPHSFAGFLANVVSTEKAAEKKTSQTDFVGFLKGGGCSRGGGNWGIWWIPREDWGTLGKIPIINSRCWKSPTLVSLFWWLGKPNVPKTSASYHPTNIYRMAHGRKLTNKLLQKEKSESQSDCHPLMHSLLAAS